MAALRSGGRQAPVMSRWFDAALHVTASGYLMRYVFQCGATTADKPFGAGSMYSVRELATTPQ
ncbi:hypothetical protein [Rhodanobacter denitrificans]|uniref:hypothetical protein n=1 Tax=Rhodanobacter denitrificans TaxID=666685 RepID=UPI0011C0258C|nr:hypothetical protein [Rhodanobacter denitrificans]